MQAPLVLVLQCMAPNRHGALPGLNLAMWLLLLAGLLSPISPLQTLLVGVVADNTWLSTLGEHMRGLWGCDLTGVPLVCLGYSLHSPHFYQAL